MSIVQTSTTSFKTELLQAVHNFGPTSADTFNIALYTAAADLNATTTVYSTSNEVVGTGYTAGGNTLVISVSPTADNNSYSIPTAYISFENTSWASASFTARAALIYKVGSGNPSVCVLDFGSDKTSATTFTVQFPAATNTSAIIRLA